MNIYILHFMRSTSLEILYYIMGGFPFMHRQWFSEWNIQCLWDHVAWWVGVILWLDICTPWVISLYHRIIPQMSVWDLPVISLYHNSLFVTRIHITHYIGRIQPGVRCCFWLKSDFCLIKSESKHDLLGVKSVLKLRNSTSPQILYRRFSFFAQTMAQQMEIFNIDDIVLLGVGETFCNVT